MAGHVVGETAQGDCLLLLGLGVVLAVTGVVGVGVLANVDFELRILYWHKLLKIKLSSFSRLSPL